MNFSISTASLTDQIAFLALLVSLATAILACFGYFLSKGTAAKAESLERQIHVATLGKGQTDQKNDINMFAAQMNVMGPYAFKLGIKKEELAEYLPKSALLMAQINLLEDTHRNLPSLSQAAVQRNEAWIRHILEPWIRNDPHLRQIMTVLYSTEDLLAPDFVQWLKHRIPPSWGA